MANTKICDRCRIKYEPYEAKGLKGDLYNVNSIETGNSIARNWSRDLCPECMAEFIKWFNMEQENGKER